MSPSNMHGTAVVFGDRGVLILGASGSGKSALGLRLLARAQAEGRFSRLVSDDQVLVSAANGRLVGTAPATIAGLAEIRGLGPAPVPFEPAALLDLVVRLVPAVAAPRMAAEVVLAIDGCSMVCLVLAERDADGACAAILAWLGRPDAASAASTWRKEQDAAGRKD